MRTRFFQGPINIAHFLAMCRHSIQKDFYLYVNNVMAWTCFIFCTHPSIPMQRTSCVWALPSDQSFLHSRSAAITKQVFPVKLLSDAVFLYFPFCLYCSITSKNLKHNQPLPSALVSSLSYLLHNSYAFIHGTVRLDCIGGNMWSTRSIPFL